MSITDPEVIKFSNESVRPLCEKIRALKAEILSLQTQWYSGVNLKVPNTSEILDDGRNAREGVSIITGANINSALSVFITIASSINDEIISIPCSNPLRTQ